MAFAHKTLKTPHCTFLCFILFLISSSQMTYSVSDGDALIKFKNSLANSNALSNWDPNTMPCQARWNGIVCFDGIVTGIHLKSMGLSGNVDVGVLTSLPGLRTITLEDNKFTGTIPEFNRLGALKAIYLTNNEFSGQIAPDYFSKMGSLKKLWLSNNKFSGAIPPSLVHLRYLIELHLDNNQFSGLIPELKRPPLISLDLSNNQLTGEIPLSLSSFEASSFAGNPNLCGQIVGKNCDQITTTNKGQDSGSNDSNNEEPKKKGKSKGLSTGVIVAVVILLVVIILVVCVAKKRKDQEKDIPTAYTKTVKAPENAKLASKANKISDGVVEVVEVAPNLSRKGSSQSSKRSNSSRRGSTKGAGVGDLTIVNEDRGMFGLIDLMKASAEVLGNGGMGSAYKAVMANGLSVVVKRMRELNKMETDAFDEEMRKLASLRHKNILPPLAYHYRKEEKLVVYEHVAKGSLHFLLHGERGAAHAELNWPTRLKIIKGTVEGLSYLHAQLAPCDLPHGNLKSSNILINLQYEPVLSDYGFNTMTNPSVVSTALFAYKSPEFTEAQTVSPKSDIYCLGVVILEILTCKFPSQYLNTTKGGTDVVQWVASAIAEGRESELLDSEIVSKSTSCKDNMVELLHVGAACTVPKPENRSSLKEVMERVNKVYAKDVGVQDERTIQVMPSLRDGVL
ncbi:pollen receptor-like kinase 3 [Silene latifolia]|uniref:pollen receptor-like kinase 3 n=1 Tax=Silene latifolia TaxID=37657 RepID=UPI003D776B8A